MNCEKHEKYLNDYIDHTLIEEIAREHLAHRNECSHCQVNFQGAILLKDGLASYPVPEPDNEFEARMLSVLDEKLEEKKTPMKQNWLASLTGGALAASILMWVFYIPNQPISTTGVEQISITIPYQQRKDVQLIFNAPLDVAVAQFTITLPENIEFYGRPGVQQLSWQTKLVSGSNRLTLPLIAKGNVKGVITAKLTSGESSKTFIIKLSS